MDADSLASDAARDKRSASERTSQSESKMAEIQNGASCAAPLSGDTRPNGQSHDTEASAEAPSSASAQDQEGRHQTATQFSREDSRKSLRQALDRLFKTGKLNSRGKSVPETIQRVDRTYLRSRTSGSLGRREAKDAQLESKSSDNFRELQEAIESRKKLEQLIHNSTQFKVGSDYKVEIDTQRMAPEMQQEFARILREPLFGDQEARKYSLARRMKTIGDASMEGRPRDIPRLTICILIVGTRGDVQPFIAIGKRLMGFGHRVRLASHANYRDFVMGEGLEFYPLGGDPKVLAEYMVKNKGLLPSGPSEVKVQRKQLKAIIKSVWPACTEADVDSGGSPFVADAIIANPPTMAHITVAEALRVPLHVFFTMPWTPTEEFPSPLASVLTSTGFENLLSYHVIENLMWIGVKGMINSLRSELRLKQIRSYHVLNYAIPYGYIWSPSLAPKPHDWTDLEDVVGFCFLDLASDYKPPQDLLDFLAAGEKPVYVGFGSLPVEEPKKLTMTIVEALKQTGQRGIIQKGWGGLGEVEDPPPEVFILDNCPHDWLFTRCKAVIHHGGAGTTAAGLRAGCPTTVVPFFGDQSFWGAKIYEAGVGPKPIPIAQFNLGALVSSINHMMFEEVQTTARLMAQNIATEDGVDGAVKAFHKHLPEDFAAGKKATPWLLGTTNIAANSMRCCWD